MPRGGAGAKKFTVSYGGWYQRTTLHLSEIFEFFSAGTSRLPLEAKKLKNLQKRLQLVSVEKELGFLEVVSAKTSSGIEIRYYEDGLYVLELEASDVAQAEEALREYFEERLSPGIAYIFSLGAPTPKVLANLKTEHPVVVTVVTEDPGHMVVPKSLGEVYQKIEADDAVVFKTDSHILIAVSQMDREFAHQLVDAQIFFREFKDQLGKYLVIHRTIWEEIAEIKERRRIGLKEANNLRSKLDRYRVTIDLITNRINQMGTYVRTRHSIIARTGLEPYLTTLFEYRFEALLDTLEYVKEIWKMTSDYLVSALAVMADVINQGVNSSIKNLTTLTIFGILVTLIKFTWEVQDISKVTSLSAGLVGLLLLVALVVDRAIKYFAERQKYQLKFKDAEKF